MKDYIVGAAIGFVIVIGACSIYPASEKEQNETIAHADNPDAWMEFRDQQIAINNEQIKINAANKTSIDNIIETQCYQLSINNTLMHTKIALPAVCYKYGKEEQ